MLVRLKNNLDVCGLIVLVLTILLWMRNSSPDVSIPPIFIYGAWLSGLLLLIVGRIKKSK